MEGMYVADCPKDYKMLQHRLWIQEAECGAPDFVTYKYGQIWDVLPCMI